MSRAFHELTPTECGHIVDKLIATAIKAIVRGEDYLNPKQHADFAQSERVRLARVNAKRAEVNAACACRLGWALLDPWQQRLDRLLVCK